MELPKFYTDGVIGEKASTPKTALPPQTVGDLIGIGIYFMLILILRKI